MKNTKNLSVVFIIIAALLMLATFILQFQPFWSVDGQGVSIAGYIGQPTSHPEMKDYMTAALGTDYTIHDIYAAPLIQQILSVLGIVLLIILCISRQHLWLSSIISGVCGILGSWYFLTQPAFQLGASWPVHLTINLATLVVSLIALLLAFRREKE